MKTLLTITLFALVISSTYGAELTLTWNDNSDNETGFVVERSIGSGVFEQLLTIDANVTEFVDLNVPLGTIVSYRVYAWNDYGDSGMSNIVAAITSQPLGPSDLKIKKTNPVAKFFNKLRGKKRS